MPQGARVGWQRARGACDVSLAYNINESMRIRRPIGKSMSKEIDSKPKGETGAIEVPRRKRVKRGSTTTGRTRRSRSLVKTPDLRLTVKKYQGTFENS